MRDKIITFLHNNYFSTLKTFKASKISLTTFLSPVIHLFSFLVMQKHKQCNTIFRPEITDQMHEINRYQITVHFSL